MAKMSGDEMALRRLLRRYTRRRDWFMVERLLNDLGNMWLEAERPSQTLQNAGR